MGEDMDVQTSTNLGNRLGNEDALGYKIIGDRALFVLCDGVGGESHGEVASALVKESLLDDFEHHYSAKFLDEAIMHAQELLLAKQKEEHEDGMKTTLTVLLIDGKEAQYAHVGDSRIYHFEKDKIVERTMDHSVAQMLVLAGDIKEKQIRNHPDRSALLRVMGMVWDEPAYSKSDRFPIGEESAFLLCSDGFWEPISEKVMMKCLKRHTCKEWLDHMNEAIAKKIRKTTNADNYSAIAIKMGE